MLQVQTRIATRTKTQQITVQKTIVQKTTTKIRKEPHMWRGSFCFTNLLTRLYLPLNIEQRVQEE